MPARPRQLASKMDQDIKRPHHGGGEGNILGMGEHGAVPNSTYRECRRRQKSRARPSDGASGSPYGADAANPGQRRNQVADGVSVERNDFLQSVRNHVEQASVKIEIPEVEQCLIGKSARVIGDNQFTIALLHFLIIGDRIIAEGEGHNCDKRSEQCRRREVAAVETHQWRGPSMS